jgi:hypothetical protein
MADKRIKKPGRRGKMSTKKTGSRLTGVLPLAGELFFLPV